MRSLLVVVAAVATVGCNSILDIPERELLVETDSGPDTSITLDTNVDTNVVETEIDSAIDTTIEDTVADSGDSSAPDTADTSIPDAADSATPDAADAATPDASDTAIADTKDSSAPDAADTSPVDSGDSGPTCGVTGKPCCGLTPGICDTNSVCAAGTCIAAGGSCVRSTDCPGVCGGPSICSGNLCFSCGASAGGGALWSTCSSSAECKFGPCDPARDVCTSACAPGITGDADCTALDPKAVCSALNLTFTSGPTMVSGVIGVCARSCARDAECRTSESCRLFNNAQMGRIDTTCSISPPGATVDTGGACTNSNECKRGLCLTVGSIKQCTPLCSTGADCPTTGWKNCVEFNFTKPGGGTQPIKACSS